MLNKEADGVRKFLAEEGKELIGSYRKPGLWGTPSMVSIFPLTVQPGSLPGLSKTV